MGIILKEVFISSIEAIRIQNYKDSVSADLIGKVFNSDSVNPYDTSLLSKTIIQLLQVFFPRDKNGFCEIEHYCFEMNFGKVDGMEFISPEDLWDRLNMKEVVVGDCTYKFTPWDLMSNPDLLTESKKVTQPNPSMASVDTFMDEIEYWKNPPVSTHPLIDDNVKKDGL